MGQATAQALRLARRLPFTLVLLAALLAVAVTTGALWSAADQRPWYADVAYGLPSLRAGRWWTVVTGSFLAPQPWRYPPMLAAVLVLVGFAELRLRTARTVAVTLLAQAVAVTGAAALLALAGGQGWAWADRTGSLLGAGIAAGAIGAAAAASATLPAPWRGRLRFVLLAWCLGTVLYVGSRQDVEHLAAVLLGLAVGPALAGRGWRMHRARLGRREWRLLTSAWTALVAVAVLLSAVLPGGGPLSGVDVEAADSTEAGGIALAVLLLLLADGLRRGRRVAWRWVLALCVLAVVGAALPPYTADSIYTGVLLAGLAIALVLGRARTHAFSVRGDPAAGRRVLLAVLVGFLALALYAIAGFVLLRGQLRVTGGVDGGVSEFLSRLLFGTSDAVAAESDVAAAFLASLTVLWLVVLSGSLLLVLWNNRRPPVSDHDEVVALLRRHGGSTLSWMSTWPDNAHWFTPDRDACIAYRVHAGVAVGLGDPVCAPGREREVLAGFSSFAEESGLLACAFSTSEPAADVARGLGWRALQVAEEAVVPLPALEFTGRRWQDVRTALNRAGKEGVTFVLGPLGDQSRRHVAEVRAISEQWVAEKGLPEMGFTLGGVEEALDPQVRVGLAVNAHGGVDGVTSWLPVFAPGGDVRGWTLDVMRRREGGFRPVTEYLIASAALAFRDEGAAVVSLSGAPLARSDDDGAGPLDRVLDALGEQLEPYYGFRSLQQFKAKFQPAYSPLYLVYPDESALPRIGVAIGRAYLPDAGVAELAALVRAGDR